ncbi:MAG: CpsD/CapB family tyrosine-protein kinase [Candidatus Omnitrophica bacterium]|nr:CpsD/CapB family tyrosine-protein kinase [Candidatus Omnitrophota bacterium]
MPIQIILKKQPDGAPIDPRVVAYYNKSSSIAEQYWSIANQLMSWNSGGQAVRLILLTSANRAEGKTVTCANIAVTLAEDKQKNILLINADMRFPQLERLFGVNAEKGLVDYLKGAGELEQIVQATAIPNLWIVPAGAATPQASELISAQKLKDALAVLKKRFHFCLIDTPACIPFSDARMLFPAVDGIVLAVRAGKTRREVVWRMQEQLRGAPGKALGVVLTNVEYYIPEYIHRHL